MLSTGLTPRLWCWNLRWRQRSPCGALPSRCRIRFRGALQGGAEVDGEAVDVTAEELEGRMQVLMPADYAAGQVRQWRVWWGGRK